MARGRQLHGHRPDQRRLRRGLSAIRRQGLRDLPPFDSETGEGSSSPRPRTRCSARSPSRPAGRRPSARSGSCRKSSGSSRTVLDVIGKVNGHRGDWETAPIKQITTLRSPARVPRTSSPSPRARPWCPPPRDRPARHRRPSPVPPRPPSELGRKPRHGMEHASGHGCGMGWSAACHRAGRKFTSSSDGSASSFARSRSTSLC